MPNLTAPDPYTIPADAGDPTSSISERRLTTATLERIASCTTGVREYRAALAELERRDNLRPVLR